MKNKLLVIGIIAVLVVAISVGVWAQAPPIEVWVDDEYIDGSCGGHNWGSDAFDNIQAGIDGVAEGGTVNVAAGTYAENNDLIIREGVTLSLDPGTTLKFAKCDPLIGLTVHGTLIAEGTGSEKITFTSNETTPVAGDWQGLIFGTTAVNSKIDNSVIEYAHNGVHVDWSIISEPKNSPVTITNSTLQNIAYRGVSFKGYDEGGFSSYYYPIQNIIITGNEFIDVGKSSAGSNPMAIYTRSAKDVDISGNLFLRGEGTYFAYVGVVCEDYNFTNNIITDPGYNQGIYVSICYTNMNGGTPVISGNSFEGTATADNFRCIYVSGHYGLAVRDNEFYTGSSGIYMLWHGSPQGGDIIENNLFDGVGTSSDDSFAIVNSYYTTPVVIRNNTIRNTNGVALWATPYIGVSCIIEGNTIENNPVGIRVGTDSWDVDTVSAHYNNIANNGIGLERIGEVSEPFDATNNWWGDASGPKQTTTNPSATGDEVSDNVDYDPWYTDEAKTTLSNAITTLSDLAVDGITVSGFDSSTLVYNKVLPYGTTTVPTVAATPTDPNASKVITQATNLTGTEAERTATILVTAKDGTTTKTYKVIFGSINVTLTKTGPTTANQGNDITYTITYKNEGTFDATNVVVTETYPTEVEYVSATPTPDAGTNNQWTIPTLAPGAEGTIIVTVHIK